LQSVLEVGDTLALFPVLKDWSTEELQALLADIDAFSAATNKAIDKTWAQIAVKPDIFFSKRGSQQIDKLRDNKKMNVLMVLSEICSVAIFYLDRRGVKTETTE
jgi:uncharacterized protein YktA (UPF0223 family)